MFFEVLRAICILFLVALWVNIALTWVSVLPGSPLESVGRVTSSIVNPILEPVRRVLPMVRLGGLGVDLSPLAVMLLVFVLMSYLT
jgi:uncharacterized protein YggT (Ycf19 family)